MEQQKNFGIYVHIPFCVSKCLYCSFISKCADEKDIKKYIDFLCEEIILNSSKHKDKVVTSIYFGGGTPSYINAMYIKKVIDVIYDNFNVCDRAEVSIECNPCSFSKEKALVYKQCKINRISFGIQSLNNSQLNTLGRKHTKEMALSAIETAKDVGFTNISADLIIGIPNQTTEDLINAVNILDKCGVKHVSAYMLMLEEGTPLYAKVKNGELKVADDDKCVDMYNSLVNYLKDLGFGRYEISNFAKDNFQCKHNQNYWDMGEYVGFGVASHSFVNGIRFASSDGFDSYYNRKVTSEILSKDEIIEEVIMLGLRTQKGISIKKLNSLGYDILKEKKVSINMLKENNIITIENNYIKLTENSFGLCSAVVLQLI